MNSLFNPPFFTAFFQGRIATGAKMFFYETGTLAPIDIFDNSGDPLPNPISADLFGQFVPVYIGDDVGEYRVKLTTSAGSTIDDVDPTDNFFGRLLAASGAGLIGFSQAETYPPSTLGAHGKVTVSATDAPFNAIGDDSTDSEGAFNSALSYLSDGGTLKIPAGTYAYANSPNWAVQDLVIECDPGVVFHHTGTGVAFNLDGGATGGGIACMRITGGPIVSGNANSTDVIYSRAVHNSEFDVEVRDGTVAGVRTVWAVNNVYKIRCSPIFRPAFSPTPLYGVYLDSRSSGETTSDCIFNFIGEGIGSYGMYLNAAVQNTFYGTSEANGGGAFISASSSGNTFINFDMEVNTTTDVLCNGDRNIFINTLSTNLFTIAGADNRVIGGNLNALTISGASSGTNLDGVDIANNGGTFTNGAPLVTTYRNLRNLTTASTYPDEINNPRSLLYIYDAGGDHVIQGAADTLVGGLPGNSVRLKAVGEIQEWRGGAKNFTLGPASMGFFGATAGGKPTITGSRGGNDALANLLSNLAALGLLTDSTT